MRLASILGAVLLLFGALDCSRGSRERTPPQAATPPQAGDATLVDLGRAVGLTFPADARLLGVSRERGIDDLVRFKVEMRAADLPALLASTPIKPDAFEPGEGGLLGPDQGFWDPNRATHLLTAQAVMKNHRALNIGIAGGGPQRVILYIVDHGT